jgi:hypothetical protein
VKYVGKTTGGPTKRFGFRGCDLGVFVPTRHGYVFSLFGDCFNGLFPGQGGGWRSPIGLRTHNADAVARGPVWDNAVGGKRARQMVDYPHQSAADASTVMRDGFTQIPCDMVHLPDGSWLLANFMIRSWEPHGPASWLTWGVRFWTSKDIHGENWQRTVNGDTGRANFDVLNDARGRFFQNVSLLMRDHVEDTDQYLYIFGTQSGRYAGGGLYLARVPWSAYNCMSRWEFWRWDGTQWGWTSQGDPSPFLSSEDGNGAIGEINAQVIDGKIVLAYTDYGIDGGTVVTRVADTPDSVWTRPQRHVTQADQPCLYAPSVHPYSHFGEDSALMHISQWTRKGFYGVHAWQVSL